MQPVALVFKPPSFEGEFTYHIKRKLDIHKRELVRIADLRSLHRTYGDLEGALQYLANFALSGHLSIEISKSTIECKGDLKAHSEKALFIAQELINEIDSLTKIIHFIYNQGKNGSLNFRLEQTCDITKTPPLNMMQ